MMKRLVSVAVLMMLALNMTVYAFEPYAASASPSLSFDGTTAECSVVCRSDKTTDEVEATLTLYQGVNYVDSWSGEGLGRVPILGSCAVKRGLTYTLKLTWSVNGVAQPTESTTAMCPR